MDVLRARSRDILLVFAAALLVGLALLAFFEPEVQELDPDELVARKDDARAFFAGDFVFVAVYGVLSPIVYSRFGRAWADVAGSAHWTVGAATLLWPLAGAVDALENVLLVTSTGSENEGRVDFAHALAAPKVALFVAALLISLYVLWRAIGFLRGRPPA